VWVVWFVVRWSSDAGGGAGWVSKALLVVVAFDIVLSMVELLVVAGSSLCWWLQTLLSLLNALVAVVGVSICSFGLVLWRYWFAGVIGRQVVL
jgi:hypothetical protein